MPDHWVLYLAGVLAYLACMVTAGAATLRKGRLGLLVAGMLLPVLWFVGWLLPARQGRAGRIGV